MLVAVAVVALAGTAQGRDGYTQKWEKVADSLYFDANSIARTADGGVFANAYFGPPGTTNVDSFQHLFFDCRGGYKSATTFNSSMLPAGPGTAMGVMSALVCASSNGSAVQPVAAKPAQAEIYHYVCKSQGRTSALKVDATNMTLEWLGVTYKIKETECGRAGWHAERDGMSFDFCTATEGYADFKLPTGTVQCDLQRR